MDNYTIFCTPEQTKKAFELGAPIRNVILPLNIALSINKPRVPLSNCDVLVLTPPTAEQMRGWLMEKLNAKTFKNTYYKFFNGFGYLIISPECILEADSSDNGKWLLESDKKATLAAIDATLKYLDSKTVK